VVSPAIALPVLATNEVLRVRFWAYVSIDGMYDRGEFFVSSDRTNWQSLMQLYHSMATTSAGAPRWQKYEFTLDPAFSGSNVYLRFRAAVRQSSPSYGCGGSSELRGVFVDDIAITKSATQGPRKVFALEAWEDASTWASCPWVAPWDGNDYVADNDIYSVARGVGGEYTDYYRLMRPLVQRTGSYPVKIFEHDSEVSFTDRATLLEVDHDPGVAVAPDERGNLHGYRPGGLVLPATARAGDGRDVQALLTFEDGQGYQAYSGDTVELNFGVVDVTRGALLVVGAKGFLPGDGPARPMVGPPAVVVETPGPGGTWIERGRLLPRFEYAVAAVDVSGLAMAGGSVTVRLRSVSHSIKYHLLDFAALYAGDRPGFDVAVATPTVAAMGGTDVLGELAAADGQYLRLSTGEEVLLEYPAMPLAAGRVRDFVFVTKGYYLPNESGTYLVHTWDGADWVLRDAITFPGSKATRTFDLSLFLPDPNGEYRVRVWQDYQYEPAGIDWVGMTVGGGTAALTNAWDLKKNASCLDLVKASDGNYVTWARCPRDRVTEFTFVPSGPVDLPPTVCPVTASAPCTPTIGWTYADPEGQPQASAEIQVWTGPGATGAHLWSGSVTGTANSIVYGGPTLTSPEAYARVRVFDGANWSQWCERALGTCTTNLPNLRMYDSVGGATVSVGQEFWYDLSFDTLNNADAAEDLRLVDPLPAELEYVSATTNGVWGVTYDAGTRTVTWAFGTWPAGVSGPTNQVYVRLKDTAVPGSRIVNQAQLVSANLPAVTAQALNPQCLACPPGVVVSGGCVPTFVAYPVETNTLRVRQTGLFHQTVAVTNGCATAASGYRLWLDGLDPAVQVHNASGTIGGVPYVQHNAAIDPGQGFEFTIEYFVATRRVLPAPTLRGEVVVPSSTTAGQGERIDVLRSGMTNGFFLVEFPTTSTNVYTVQYSDDGNRWRAAAPEIAGTGGRVVWMDIGPPKTASLPAVQPMRLYRLLRRDP
jgi:hypothetical protein